MIKNHNTFIICFLLLAIGTLKPNSAKAQHEELKQKIAAFVSIKDSAFEKKYLNVTEPEYGELNNTNFEFHDFFMLKAKERTENSIGNRVKLKYYYSFFAYESELERDYAVSFWFKNFLEERRITPGRDMRTYKNAEPTIVVINKTSVCVLTFDCQSFDPEAFRALRNEMLAYFGSPESIMIEINCGGPLKWTKNPPDPKDRKWRL